MRKLLMLIGALIMSNAYGEGVIWYTDANNISVNSCSNGGSITKPANPSHPTDPDHYRFIGWKENYDGFTAINSTSSSCPSSNSNAPCNGTCSGIDTACSWTFPYGSATGGWACVLESASSTDTFHSGTRRTSNSVVSNVQDYKYQSCWCKITSLTVKGVSITVPGKWVYFNTMFRDCQSNCYNYCKNNIGTYSPFRKYVMFGK